MVQITPVCIFAAYVFICRTMHFKIKYQYKQNRFADKGMVIFSEFIHILFLKRYFVQMFIIRHVESDFSPSFRLNMQPIPYNKWFHVPQCDQHWYSAGAGLRTFKEWSKVRIYTWWRHQMKTIAALLVLCVVNLPVTSEFPHKDPWRWALIFSLICAWINGWVSNRWAGDLRRHRVHHDVIVMIYLNRAYISQSIILYMF